MSFWGWFTLWAVLVVGALVLLGWLGYRLFRKGLAVLRELGAASDSAARTSAVSNEAFDEWLAVRAEQDAADAAERTQGVVAESARQTSARGRTSFFRRSMRPSPDSERAST